MLQTSEAGGPSRNRKTPRRSNQEVDKGEKGGGRKGSGGGRGGAGSNAVRVGGKRGGGVNKPFRTYKGTVVKDQAKKFLRR